MSDNVYELDGRTSLARLRAALVQVAAVAVAIVEDLDTGFASKAGLSEALANVAEERDRQNAQWGAQHHTPAIWLAILAEEVGEVAREVDTTTLPRGWWELKELVEDLETAARWILDHLDRFEPERRHVPSDGSARRGRHLAVE